jgi:hypothetical protein
LAWQATAPTNKALDNFPPPRILGLCIDVPGCWPGPSLRQLPKRPKIQPRHPRARPQGLLTGPMVGQNRKRLRSD